MEQPAHRGLGYVEQQVRAHLVQPVPPSEPRRAVTVVLLRDSEAGPEAFLLERAPTMAFAAGQTVFPGGSVDAADADVVVDADGVGTWAAEFGCALEEARALLVAAVREVFEETGVLLTAPTCTPDLADQRAGLLNGERTFADVLSATGSLPTTRLLVPWARWVTPTWSRRRYDTHFFVAQLPAGQQATDDCSEAFAAAWRTPADALARTMSGQSAMFTPTVETLREIETFASVAEVMAAPRDLGLSSFSLRHSAERVTVHVDRPGSSTMLLEFQP